MKLEENKKKIYKNKKRKKLDNFWQKNSGE